MIDKAEGIMCLLLPTVSFNSYRGKGGNMLIPTGSHRGSFWGKNQLPFPLLCWRGVKGAGLCWAPAPSRWAKPGSGLPQSSWPGVRALPWPPGHCCHQLPLLLALHSVCPQGCLLQSRMSCRCLNVSDSSVVFVRNGRLKNGITKQKSKQWFLKKKEIYSGFLQRV